MPVWHETTRQVREAGKIEVVGVIQEQHPDRCRLFMQWKQMDWPILVDPLNLLELSVVPIALLIDEKGIVREVMRDPRSAVSKLTGPLGDMPQDSSNRMPGSNPAIRRVHEALFLSDEPQLGAALRILDEALRDSGSDGRLHFARGVAYRMRYDSLLRQPGDFAAAVDDWQKALDLNPNQYIWRRRIQQYGAQLDKPYPFYDWVEQARRDIRERDETPTHLFVEPVGAEVAGPTREFSTADSRISEPDPKGRIARDKKKLVTCEVTVVPPKVAPGQAARVHIVLRPNPQAGGHWNNEGEPLAVWVNPPTGWSVSAPRLTVPTATQPVSDELRSVEFELRAPDDAPSGTIRVPAYALYGVCEGPSGTCLYRRADLVGIIEVCRTP